MTSKSFKQIAKIIVTFLFIEYMWSFLEVIRNFITLFTTVASTGSYQTLYTTAYTQIKVLQEFLRQILYILPKHTNANISGKWISSSNTSS